MPAAQSPLPTRLIPAILVLAFLTDVAFHFVRLDFLAFRGDEVMRQVVPLHCAYERNRHFQSDRTWGDIASMANLPGSRVYRPQTFTTDGFGFRNTPSEVQLPPSVLLLGSSFTVGTANSDDQTLARQMAQMCSCSVYNGGGWDRVIANTRRLIRQLGMKKGLVLMEFLERDAWGPPIVLESKKPRIPYGDVIWWYRNQATESRLKIIAQRMYKSLCNGRLLPNTFRSQAAERELINGTPMLFLVAGERHETPPNVSDHILMIRQFRDALREDGYQFGVYLLPDKLVVYRDLLKVPVPWSRDGVVALAEIERKLRSLDIPTINLEPIFHEEASKALRRGELIYWADDTHWNPEGIGIAAREISRAFQLRCWAGSMTQR